MTELLEKLENVINEIDGAYTGDYHKDSELANIGNVILEARNRLKTFIEKE